MSNNNRCVCCGEIIPEGKQVCVKCEEKANAPAKDVFRFGVKPEGENMQRVANEKEKKRLREEILDMLYSTYNNLEYFLDQTKTDRSSDDEIAAAVQRLRNNTEWVNDVFSKYCYIKERVQIEKQLSHGIKLEHTKIEYGRNGMPK